MAAFYNEIDPRAAAWLRELMARGQIAEGIVDERDIRDIVPADLLGFTQCHFFAGIGVWSYALRRAGWPDDRPVWTGSCPCQPFSAAGKGAGFADERHLWPSWFWLIEQCRPPVVFGEQVASKDAEPWIDLVQDDLEAVDYGVGAVPFPTAGVGAPHIRDRLYWVADAGRSRGQPDGLDLGSAPRSHEGQAREREWLRDDDRASRATDNPGPTNGLWRDADWLLCRDGKFRPVEPGTFPLVDGAPVRVGRLRGYGNAINAEAARVFVEAFIGGDQ